MTLSRGRDEFIPISSAKSCKVVVDKAWGRYLFGLDYLQLEKK